MTTVTCACCATTFPALTHDQAYGCATEVIIAEGVKGLYGAYGSTVADGTFFAFTTPTAQHADLDLGVIVCDACLTTLRDGGHIAETPYPLPAPVAVDDDTPTTVICARCTAQFSGFSPTQAHGCATEIFETSTPTGIVKGVCGHFGSTVADLQVFEFTPKAAQASDLPADGLLCDACVTVLIESGALETGKLVHHPMY